MHSKKATIDVSQPAQGAYTDYSQHRVPAEYSQLRVPTDYSQHRMNADYSQLRVPSAYNTVLHASLISGKSRTIDEPEQGEHIAQICIK